MFVISVAKIVVFAGIFGRLVSLQINESKKYRTLSDKNRFREWKLVPQRGIIEDFFGEKIADNTRQEIHEKMREVQQQPGTLATQGSVQTEQSPDDSVFDAILGQTNELEEAFGI